jgi:DNA-directed RNA polymerase subunit RPC12/RpoP
LIGNSFRRKIRALMPWKCPACSTQIRHSDAEPAPRPGVIYRCPVCRLELVVDERTTKLTVAPLSDDRRS